jgi:hypothetical protein
MFVRVVTAQTRSIIEVVLLILFHLLTEQVCLAYRWLSLQQYVHVKQDPTRHSNESNGERGIRQEAAPISPVIHV